ncbi:hypothetical protein SEA_NOVASHARKS_54 [Gordonia phage NovaSharks]|nr:hypothetical protein SEA_NOVASHARKS_54 [Gordonia phage NovaSharks]UVK63136.1 hypothetical protein SEA_RUMI_53 [Gordonia phage Rumi]WNM65359.1 hypothetical protein SEA_ALYSSAMIRACLE_55 [Gordonia phage Alyssamiracle]
MKRAELVEGNALHDSLKRGHLIRMGHPLVAHLESKTGEVWHIVRECCPKEES